VRAKRAAGWCWLLTQDSASQAAQGELPRCNAALRLVLTGHPLFPNEVKPAVDNQARTAAEQRWSANVIR
jgi:hypothetical protein